MHHKHFALLALAISSAAWISANGAVPVPARWNWQENIEELYAWEFEGPFLSDFTGRKPAGPRRDVGAIEKAD